MEQRNNIQLENINIEKIEPLFSPQELKEELVCEDSVKLTVFQARETIQNILLGDDKRFLGLVGPCSIHDKESAIEYAQRFKELGEKVKDTMYLVMRVYFEKPRTTLGWRGLLIDPDMNNTNNISGGLRLGREILLQINTLGVPAGSEYLDPVVPNYIDDLVCWASIGARTIESQTHRDMASGVSVPVGFKNSTDGDVNNAINAMLLSANPRGFIGINSMGDTSIVHTKGNTFTHLILRGGRFGPNYFPEDIDKAAKAMEAAQLPSRIMVDCSHGNSLKKYKNQSLVLHNILQQYIAGEKRILGFMLESNLKEGRQEVPDDVSKLEYGKSVTDACMSFEETEQILLRVDATLKKYSIENQYGVYTSI